MSKFIISGVSGFRNRGVDALVTTTVQGIKSIDSSASITVISDTPDYDIIHGKKLSVHFLQDVLKSRRAKLARRIIPFSNKIANLISPNFQHTLDALENVDVVIASGGDIFSSDYGDQADFLIPLEMAQKSGKKVVFMGQSIGPYKTKDEADVFLSVARRSDLITVRESISYNYVCKKLGVPESKVELTADSAFVLKIPDKSQIDQLAFFYGIDKNLPIVALSISQGIIRFSGTNTILHFNAWKNIIKTIIEDLGAQVLLIPHVQERATFNDDRIVQTAIAEEFGYNAQIKLISGDHSASELKGVISLADLVIAERMHAGIAGLSNGIPTALVGYSIKAQGVIHDILGEKVNEYKLLISIQDMVKDFDISQWIKNIWGDREIIAAELRRKLPEVKDLAHKNFELLGKLMK
ncbi:MAG TPA: polysaccharide pyruvyl transferase family protein [Bacilli bacterium]